MSTHFSDDRVAAFQIDSEPVRGRIVRLGAASIDPILRRHDYPPELARLLGEALVLAALVGEALKFDGRLMVQAEGNGPVTMLVAEHTSDGDLRGYARRNETEWDALMTRCEGVRPSLPDVFGPKGVLGLIIVPADPSMHPYQSVVPLSQPRLAGCARDHFDHSQQVPSEIAIAVGELSVPGLPPVWQGGGLLLQRVAGDSARGDTQDAWETARALFSTVTDSELIDPDITSADLLYRLFHETGVRMETGQSLHDACSCNEDRLRATLAGLSDEGLRDLVEPDGRLSVNCKFCNRHYAIALKDVTAPTDS